MRDINASICQQGTGLSEGFASREGSVKRIKVMIG
jgi:hypothetical protein